MTAAAQMLSDDSIQSVTKEINMLYGAPMSVISDCLRGFLKAPAGKTFAVVDFSQIEARVLAWLAGEEKVLDVFKTGKDIYLHAASGIYSLPESEITPAQRLIGKVATLALGFQGGLGAFQTMARVYNLKIGDDLVHATKNKWREANPKIVKYWYDLESAAIGATLNPNQPFRAGAKGREVIYLKMGSFLMCRLPSDHVIVYPYPKVKALNTPWGDKKDTMTYMASVTQTQKKTIEELQNLDDEVWIDKSWRREPAYGGLLAENNTQAVARDLLADAMLRLDDREKQIVVHVHDEVVCEVDETNADKELSEIEKITCETPKWATGLPINAEGFHAKRYCKK